MTWSCNHPVRALVVLRMPLPLHYPTRVCLIAFGGLQVSVVDQRPEELIAATAIGMQVQYAAGLGPSGNSSSLRFSVDSIQIDDEIPGTR